jgi:hypothetical protein
MKRAIATLVTGILVTAALTPAPAEAQFAATTPPDVLRVAATTTSEEPPVDRRLLAIGAGAVVAVVAFNVLAAPLGTVPLAGAALDAVPYSVALGSRLIAVTTAGAGALAATWAYDRWTGHKSDYAYLLSLGAGALAGVAVANLLTAGAIGLPPYYAGAGVANAAGAMTSTAAQAASRVYVIGSAVIGAWVADSLYRSPHAPAPPPGP